jgi:uncharacterized membrane protein YkvI
LVRAGLKWMFLILGTMIGAGYASGRELWLFFGQESTLAIVLFTLFFIICMYVVMTLSSRLRTQHYMPVLEQLLGKKVSTFYDIVIFIYLYTTTVVMIAGGGASLEVLNIPYLYGVFIISSCLILLFIGGNKGLVTLNVITIPVLIVFLVGVLFKSVYGDPHAFIIDWQKQSNWHASIMFTSLNIVSLVAVIGGLGNEIKTKGEIWIATVGSGLILGGISFLYNQSLLQNASVIPHYEIPLFALIKNDPFIMTIAMSGLLWIAIYTTAASGIFGLITRMKNRFKGPLWLLALIMTLTMIPLTTFGFSSLVSTLYPIYGVLNLYFLASLLIYPLLHRVRKFKSN